MKKRTYSNPVGVSRFTGLLLVIPFAVGFLLFTLYPFAASFITGLHSYENIRSPEFTGLSNYRSMITDEDFLSAASVTLRYAAFLVPIKLLVSLLTIWNFAAGCCARHSATASMTMFEAETTLMRTIELRSSSKRISSLVAESISATACAMRLL